LNAAVEALVEALREGGPITCTTGRKLHLMLLFAPEIAQRRASIHKFTDAVHTLEATLFTLVGLQLQQKIEPVFNCVVE
jgi:hypothetical protein